MKKYYSLVTSGTEACVRQVKMLAKGPQKG